MVRIIRNNIVQTKQHPMLGPQVTLKNLRNGMLFLPVCPLNLRLKNAGNGVVTLPGLLASDS